MELKPEDLFKEWKAGKFRPVYYLMGEEASDKAQALKALKEFFKPDDFNFSQFSGDFDIKVLISEAMTLPVFASRRLIIAPIFKITAEDRAALTDYLKNPLSSTTLAFVSQEKKADPKDALLRAALSCGALCVFSPLKEPQAQQRLIAKARAEGKTLSPEAAALLIAEAGTDWTILSQELEKVLLFSSSKEIGAQDVLQSLGYSKSADPFALGRLVEERRLKESLAQLLRLLKDGKPEDQVFKALNQINSCLQKQLRAKLLLKAKTPAETIFKSLRLHSYWDRDYLSKLERLSEERLTADLKRCLETEANLKSKAWLDAKIELEHLIVDLCRTQALAGAAAAATR